MSRRISSKKTFSEPPLDYRKIFELSGLLFVVLDRAGKIVTVNEKTCRFLGLEQKKLVGLDWFDRFLPAGGRARVRAAFGELIRGEEKAIEFFENAVIAARGKERLVRWHNMVLHDEDEKFLYCVSVGDDVTGRADMEKKLKQLAEFNQRIIDASPVGIFVISKDGAIEYANRAILDLSGTPKEKMIGYNLIASPAYKNIGLDLLIKRSIEGKKPFKTDIIKYRSYFGKKLSFRIFTGTPLFNDSGEVEKLILTIEDETEVKKKTDELEQFNQLMVGRELKMIELKAEVARLKKLLNKV